ncbi:MAG: helical backbone metal receptor, partial [Acidiferrobacterales bacterium]
AGDIPRIGDASGLNLEKIVGLRPDLVVAWKSGNPPRVVKRLEELGIPVFRSEPRSMGDIAENIEDLGMLADTLDVARRESADFRLRYSDLRSRYAHRKAVGVFYQIWHSPLMTVNGQHLISDVIQLCGGINVFSNLPTLTPQIDIEAVLQANPTAIVAAGFNDSTVLDGWKKWTYVDAVKKDNLFLIPFNLIARQSPRILDGAERLCAALQKARASYE